MATPSAPQPPPLAESNIPLPSTLQPLNNAAIAELAAHFFKSLVINEAADWNVSELLSGGPIKCDAKGPMEHVLNRANQFKTAIWRAIPNAFRERFQQTFVYELPLDIVKKMELLLREMAVNEDTKTKIPSCPDMDGPIVSVELRMITVLLFDLLCIQAALKMDCMEFIKQPLDEISANRFRKLVEFVHRFKVTTYSTIPFKYRHLIPSDAIKLDPFEMYEAIKARIWESGITKKQ